MSRSRLTAAVLLGCLVFLPASIATAQSQTNEELQKQVEALTKRVEALEKQRAAPAAAAAKPDAASTALSNRARAEAQALYVTIDEMLSTGKLAEANEALAGFDAKYAGTAGAGWTRSLKREMAVVGKETPAGWFIEKWYQGESDVDLDGAPTLLIFWESWCPHCRNEIPKMQKLHDQYAAKGLQVVGVTRITKTATEESVKEFIAGNNVSYPMAKETGALAEYFNVKGIPAAAVVKDGKIVWRGHPIRVTDELLASWL